MKKLDSNQDKESLLKEVKRLRKENKKLLLSAKTPKSIKTLPEVL